MLEGKFEILSASSNGNEIWVMLLEKAYARAFKSYSNILTESTNEVITNLTGNLKVYKDGGGVPNNIKYKIY